eukprot:g4753.t1
MEKVLLSDFLKYDILNKGEISAAAFQKVLSQHGLKFGDPLIDKVLLNCIVNEEGFVQLYTFAESLGVCLSPSLKKTNELNSSSSLSMNKDSKTFTADQKVLSATACENVQPPLYQTLPPSIPKKWTPPKHIHRRVAAGIGSNLSQKERVNIHARGIHRLFSKYNYGKISLDEFLDGLHELGIVETDESCRLLRTSENNHFNSQKHSTHHHYSEITYSKLMQALTAPINDSSIPIDAVAGKVAAGHRNKSRPKCFHTKKMFTEVGESKDSNIPDNVMTQTLQHIRINKDVSQAPKSTASGEPIQQGARIKKRIGLGTGNDSIYDSSQTKRLLEVVHDGELDSEAWTSRHFRREQLFAWLRAIDCGDLSVNQFLRNISKLGVKDLPLGCEKQLRMLAGGEAKFGDVVRSFAHVLYDGRTRHDRPPAEIEIDSTHSANNDNDIGDVGERRRFHSNMYKINPITWYGGRENNNVVQNSKKSMIKMSEASRRKLKENAGSRNLLVWSNSSETSKAQHPSPPLSTNSRYSARNLNNRSHGDILKHHEHQASVISRQNNNLGHLETPYDTSTEDTRWEVPKISGKGGEIRLPSGYRTKKRFPPEAIAKQLERPSSTAEWVEDCHRRSKNRISKKATNRVHLASNLFPQEESDKKISSHMEMCGRKHFKQLENQDHFVDGMKTMGQSFERGRKHVVPPSKNLIGLRFEMQEEEKKQSHQKPKQRSQLGTNLIALQEEEEERHEKKHFDEEYAWHVAKHAHKKKYFENENRKDFVDWI